jgi:hypothetical protein
MSDKAVSSDPIKLFGYAESRPFTLSGGDNNRHSASGGHSAGFPNVFNMMEWPVAQSEAAGQLARRHLYGYALPDF